MVSPNRTKQVLVILEVRVWKLLSISDIVDQVRFGLGHLTEFMEDDDEEDESELHDQCQRGSFP